MNANEVGGDARTTGDTRIRRLVLARRIPMAQGPFWWKREVVGNVGLISTETPPLSPFICVHTRRNI